MGGNKFRRQHPYDDYILDFVCLEKKLVIEVDGGQHAGSIRDRQRDRFLENCGFKVLRFWNNDILTKTDAALELIHLSLAQPNHPHPGPPLEGEGK